MGIQEITGMEEHISTQKLAQVIRTLQEQIQQLQEQLQGQVNKNI